ncbi:MAG TPA: DUF4097 family beta strand repeat-containing protein [Candidatus Limnocylindria bacterium]
MAVFVRTQEIEHEIGPSGRFALRVTSPEVHLRAVDGGRAVVRVTFELRAGSEEEADQLFKGVRYKASPSPHGLEVQEPRRGEGGLGVTIRLFGKGSSIANVSVSADVPRGAEIAYDGVSADVRVAGFRGSQHYQTVSGDMIFDHVAGDLRIRGVSSDVTVRADEPMRLQMNTVSGDVSALAPRFDELRLVTVSGDLELEGELAAAMQHRVETVSGDLSLGVVGGLTLEVRGLSSDTHVSVPHRSEGSRDRRRYIIGGGEAGLLFSSMSGDVSVHPTRRLSSIPTPPTPPIPPTAPTPPSAPTPPTPPATPVAPDEQMAILRALERGEIDVDEASARLAGSKPGA